MFEIYTKKDLKIISELRQDSRNSLTKMSRKTGIPVSTIFERIKYAKGDLIKKNTCLIDFSELGLDSRAKIALKTIPSQRKELKNMLQKNINVNSLYKINNGFDYMIDVVFKNIKEMEEFLENMEDNFNIKKKHVFYLIEEISREKIFSDLNTIDYLGIKAK